jgi:tetratricopeptide (TPR) repeat protein
VIDGIALNWDPITSNALSKQIGVEPTTLSSQLIRLKKDGLIEEVETSGSRAGFQLAERFLNIWYLMRHGTRKTKQRLRWFTVFLIKLFNAEELEKMAGDARNGVGKWRVDHREAVIEAYDLKMLSLEKVGMTSDQKSKAAKLVLRAVDLIESRKAKGAIRILDELIVLLDADSEPRALAICMRARGLLLGELDRSEDEIAVYDELIARFGESDETALREEVAITLVYKGHSLRELGRSEDEISIYDELIARFGESDETALQVQVAKALVDKGFTLGMLGRPEDAIAAYDDVVARFGESAETELQEQVAKALVNKGSRLGALNRSEDANTVYKDVVARFGESAETVLQKQVAIALVKVSQHLFWNIGKRLAAEGGIRTVLQRDPDNILAKANLLWMFIAMGQQDEASGLLRQLDTITGGGRALMQAGCDLAADNLGSSLDHLAAALDLGLVDAFDFSEDLLWYLRIAAERGYGERMIDWFAQSGNADRYAPIYGAFVAHVRGERFLLDLNPEVRGVAQPLFAKLSAGKKHGDTKVEKKARK